MIKQFIDNYTADLHDSVINNIILEYVDNKNEGSKLEIKININIMYFRDSIPCCDLVELHFIDVDQFSFSDKKGNGRLIHESKIKIIDSEILFDFSYYNEWETKNELINAYSKLFLISKDFKYKVIS